MRLYTKILIGMAVGAILGVTAGPKSPFLSADTLEIDNAGAYRFALDEDGQRGELLNLPKKYALMLTLEEEPPAGEAWVRVRMNYDQRLRFHDQDGAIQDALGVERLGERATVWMERQSAELEGGESIYLPEFASGLGIRITNFVKPFGTLFLRLIKMVIVPLVFASLLVGVAGLGDVRKLGRLGGRTLITYLLTTAVAISIGLIAALIFQPGRFVAAKQRAALQAQFSGAASSKVTSAAEAPTMVENLLAIVPENPLAALVNGDMLPVIFFAIMLGIALTLIKANEAQPVVTFFDRIQEAMVMLIHIVMQYAPIGVAALVADVVGRTGLSVLGALLAYAAVVVFGLLLHTVLVYGGIAIVWAGLKPKDFLRAIRPAQLIAFSTSSSSATLPVSMECAEENLGVSNSVSSFVLPLGATVNMDGTALYQGVAAIFIAQVFDISLSIGDQLAIVLTATAASIGAAGVPGAGMVTLAMVLTTTGIPTVGVALILGMDRLLDMFRTTVNVTGDIAVTAAMAKAEGEVLRPLSKEADVSDPEHGFEGRLSKGQHPVVPEEVDD